MGTGFSARDDSESMVLRTYPVSRLLIFLLLSATDLAFTYLLVGKMPPGMFREGNPFADAWLARFDWNGLLIYKVIASALFVVTVVYIGTQQPRKAQFLSTFGCLVLGGVLAYSCYLVHHTEILP